MPAFSISKDPLGVLRLRRRAYPALSLEESEVFELSASVYGHLVERCESLSAPQFLARIRQRYASEDPRQKEIERVIELCHDHRAHVQPAPAVPSAEPASANLMALQPHEQALLGQSFQPAQQ